MLEVFGIIAGQAARGKQKESKLYISMPFMSYTSINQLMLCFIWKSECKLKNKDSFLQILQQCLNLHIYPIVVQSSKAYPPKLGILFNPLIKLSIYPFANNNQYHDLIMVPLYMNEGGSKSVNYGNIQVLPKAQSAWILHTILRLM